MPGGIIRPHIEKLEALDRLFDHLVIVGTLYASALPFWPANLEPYHLAAILSLGLFALVSESARLYQSWRGSSLREEVTRFARAWSAVMLSLIVIAFLIGADDRFPRVVIVSWYTGTLAVGGLRRVGVRLLLREMRRRGFNSRQVAIAGYGPMARRIEKTIFYNPHLGLRLGGFYDDRSPERLEKEQGARVRQVGNLDDLVVDARAGNVDLIYISLSLRAEQRINELIRKLSKTTASVYLVPDFFTYDVLQARWTTIAGIPAVSVVETPFRGVDGMLKRIEDLTLGSAILLVALVPLLVIAAIVRITSGAPVIFKQRRFGLDGKEIVVWKFRTMKVTEDGKVVPQATRNDSRVTRVGTFLRRMSLDELPQFINVLQGRMSIVGPRPHAIAHNEYYRSLIDRYMLRHKVRPGITGLAQVNGLRGETETLDKMEKRVYHDLQYIREWSLLLDLKIIYKTVLNIFTREAAY